MKIIVHEDNNLETYYLIDSNGKVIANATCSSDLFTDTMVEDRAKLQRADSIKRRLVQAVIFNTEVFYDDSKECKEFLIDLKKDEIEKDFNDESN